MQTEQYRVIHKLVRKVLAGLALLLLAGCGREAVHPYPQSRTPPWLAPRFFPPDGWAWGQVAVERTKAPIRYGVAAPSSVPRASVVILAGADESAETYFETARNLIGHGYTVWVLEASPSPQAGADALKALIDGVVRPKPQEALVVAGFERGAVAALIAAEAKGPRFDGLVLS
jgi:lysophospholipase